MFSCTTISTLIDTKRVLDPKNPCRPYYKVDFMCIPSEAPDIRRAIKSPLIHAEK